MARRERSARGSRRTGGGHRPAKRTKKESLTSTGILDNVKSPGRVREKKKLTGMSLTLKFAILISFVSGLLCFLSGLLVYYNVKDSMIEEIDSKGASLVKSISNLAKEYYEQCERIRQQLRTANSAEQKNALWQKREQVRKTFEGYLENMTTILVDGEKKNSESILSLIIDSSNKAEIPPLSSGSQQQRLSGTIGVTYEERFGQEIYKTDIDIIQGELKNESGSFGVRAYVTSLAMNQNEELRPCVMLSERDIENTTNAILFGISLTTLGAILIGIASSFILASHVTNPLRRLVKDIEEVARGNLNHGTAIVSSDEIGLLAHTFNNMTKSLKVAHQHELEHQAREHELQIASEIQTHLLPKDIPQMMGLDIAVFYESSKEVGGDYYDFIEIDDDHLGIIVADVAGKGIPGSMVMTMARSLIRMEASRNQNFSPAETLKGVNKIIAQDIKLGMFVTAMYCILKKSTGDLKIASAGHNPAVIYRGRLREYELINTKGMALGLDKGKIFEKTAEEKVTRLQKGDLIVLYTDGVPEAMSAKNEEFGDERFYQLIAKYALQTPQDVVDKTLDQLKKWRGSAPQSDDITIVALKSI